MDRTNNRETGLRVMSEMFGPEVASYYTAQTGGFCPDFMNMAIDNVYGGIWGRPGLSRRDRSLLTIGILIQAGALDALRVHLNIALQNGLTKDELAEVICHATAYSGFPKAHSARDIAIDVLGQ